MAYKGIDVSKHNGIIDWEKVKKAEINFAMIRAGYGANNIDERFKYNISECNRLGIPCGVYWFSYALNAAMAKKEAQYCLEAVKPYKLEYPIAFDFEYGSVDYAKKQGINVAKKLATDIMQAFCSEIEKAGYYALNYSNIDYLNNYFEPDVAKRYGLWLAQWNNNLIPSRDCQIWQHSETGKVNGIAGNVDLNRGYIDFPKIIKERGLNGFKKVEQPKKDEKPYYADAQEWVMKEGISDGTKPLEAASRAEIWTMLKRYHDKFGK